CRPRAAGHPPARAQEGEVGVAPGPRAAVPEARRRGAGRGARVAAPEGARVAAPEEARAAAPGGARGADPVGARGPMVAPAAPPSFNAAMTFTGARHSLRP